MTAVSLTWSQLLERVDSLAGGLAALGVKRGDTVAIMLANRPEFHVVDLAAVTIGATPFSIYTTYPAEEIRYLMNDAVLPGRRSSSRRSSAVMLRGARGAAPARARDRHRRRGARGHGAAVRRRGLESRLRRGRRGRRGRSRRRADADLHVRHDRPPEGRAAHRTTRSCSAPRRWSRSSTSRQARA